MLVYVMFVVQVLLSGMFVRCNFLVYLYMIFLIIILSIYKIVIDRKVSVIDKVSFYNSN